MEGTDTVYLFVARKAEADLCSEYAEAIRQTLKEFVPQGIYHLKDIFAMLMNIGKHRSFNLFIDEFQDFHMSILQSTLTFRMFGIASEEMPRSIWW